MQRKIAVFCHNFEINGANHALFLMVKNLVSCYEFTIFSPRDGSIKKRFLEIGVEAEVFEYDEKFKRTLSQFSLGIVNSLIMTTVAQHLLEQKIPYVLIVHETWSPDKINFYIHELWQIMGLMEGDVLAGLRGAQFIIYPASYLQSVYQDIVTPQQTRIIRYTIDFDGIEQFRTLYSRQSAREHFGIEPDECLFIQVGTVTKRKAQRATLDAFCQMLDQYTNFSAKLFFVGARSFRPGEEEYIRQLEQIIRKKHLKNQVRIFEVREDIYRFFLAADVLVHPSINEVLPLAILEACAFGLPVIASCLDGIPEAIRHYKEGILVNPGDINEISQAMILLGQNSKIRVDLGQQAKQRVETEYSKQLYTNSYRLLIESVFKENVRI